MLYVSHEKDWEGENPDILRCLRDAYCPAIASVSPEAIRAYYQENDQSLPVTMRWILHKYRHSIEVFEAGLRLMQERPLLEATESIRKDWKAALLLHDIARVDELSASEQWLFHYPHGTVGIERLYRLGFRSPLTLIPVFLHDRFDCTLNQLSLDKLPRLVGWEKMPETTRQLVSGLIKRFLTMPEEEKNTVVLGANLLMDSDQLGNLLHFKSMLALSEDGAIPVEPRVSPKIRDALLQGAYVQWSDVQSYADRVLGFMAWMSFGHFPSFSRILLEERVAPRMLSHLLNQVVLHCPHKDIRDFRDELSEYQRLLERRLRRKLTESAALAPES